MRFRIRKSKNGSDCTIVVTDEMDKDAGWDVLAVAQTMLNLPLCTELILDFRSVVIVEELSMFHLDTLAAVFEEGLLQKDSAVVIRYREDKEIRFCSDQRLLEPSAVFAPMSVNEARFFGRPMDWLAPDPRFLVN